MSPKFTGFRPRLPAKLKDEARDNYRGGGGARGGKSRGGRNATATSRDVIEPKGHIVRGGPGLGSVGRGGWSRVRSRKEERKAARLEKKRKRFGVPQKSAANVPAAGVKRKRPEKDGGDEELYKKQKSPKALKKLDVKDVSGHDTKKKSKLDSSSGGQKKVSGRGELDPEMERMKEGVEAEEKLQKALAKRLNMKMSAMKATGLSDLLPGYDDEEDFGENSSDDEPELHQFQAIEPKKTPKHPPAQASEEHSSDQYQSESEMGGLSDEGNDLSDMEESDLDSAIGTSKDGSGFSDQELSDGESEQSEEGLSEDDQEEMPGKDATVEKEAAPIASKYVPPALRNQRSSEKDAVERRVRSLLNKVVEENLQAVVAEVVEMYGQESRSIVSGTLVEEIVKAAARGPKATDQFVGIAAALLAGISGSANAQDLAANFLSQLAIELEQSYANDDALACRNMVTLFCHCYLCDLIGSDLVYSLLEVLTGRFKERDIIMMYALLQACGLRLRAEDPVGMKDFVVRIHERAGQAGKEGELSSQGEVMLDLVLDIKNNRKKDRGSGSKFKHLSESIGKWLKESGVGNVKLGVLTWQKLIAPNKRGLWWLPEPGKTLESRVVNSIISNSRNAPGGMELLSLARALRMTTDTRRAIFCVVMGSEDFLDAFNRLLGLPLKGNQQHEVIRVIVECCLHEKSWNPFYSHLIIKLCAAGISGHKTTLQYCLWDRFTQVNDMEIRKMDNLTRLTASVVSAKVLPVKMCKAVDFLSLEGRSLLFWRIVLSRILLGFKHSDQCVEAFGKLSITDATKPLQRSMLVFFRNKLGPWIANLDGDKVKWVSKDQLGLLLKRLRSIEGVLSSDNRIA